MKCGNLVIVMTYGPPIPYFECGREPCNGVPKHVKCGNLVTVNDLWSPMVIWNMGTLYPSLADGPQYLIWNVGTL